MSALLRFIPAGVRKWLVLGLALLIVAGILTRLLGGSSASMIRVLVIGLVALLAIGAAWVLIHFLTRAARKRKQRTFDASLAAKEGIEDRKREWQSWVQELEKADIDRYELPFYLLLGEPQSGKSILLQNSDLNFLFGQNRLSGVGGTRGCDWWFTHEAVILDLAGRLFTHEGGAADEAEWEAFLDLLNSFRPMDPANGIMLVIPCDSLLSDSLETSRKKASQIREALFMLTRKLQAKLPIYVILTKGDKIFGFAESVHRLEAEQRKQMFGWSRPMDRLEHPFQSEELGEAWDGFVASASSLRDSMLATARIPEAIPEVDRMMAFPSELQGMYLAVEAYMTRIFQGSDLLDQLYFRGIYLTSGLQSGAPIAKVGLEILDRPGDADNRDLETLFVRQQAYFIRDLVRSRVFAERGLVRPTGARTKRVQKNAWIGYGVAAGFAVLAAGFSAYSFFGNRTDKRRTTIEAAIAAGENYKTEEARKERLDMTNRDDVLAVIEDIKKVHEAATLENKGTQAINNKLKPQLVELEEALATTLFPRELQNAAARALSDRLQRPDAMKSARDFERQAETAAILTDGFKSRAEASQLLDVIPAGDSTVNVDDRLEDALGESASAVPCEDPSREVAVAAINSRWDDLTNTASDLCLEDPLRTFVALFEIQEEKKKIEDWDLEIIGADMVAESCANLTRSLGALKTAKNETAGSDEGIEVDQLAEFLGARYDRMRSIRDRIKGEGESPQDTRLDKFHAFVAAKMKGLQPVEGAPRDDSAAKAQHEAVRAEVRDLLRNDRLERVIAESWGVYSPDPSIRAFNALLAAASSACEAPAADDEGGTPMEVTIAQVKTRALSAKFMQLNASWEDFVAHATAGTEAPVEKWKLSSQTLTETAAAVGGIVDNPAKSSMRIGELSGHVQKLAKEGLLEGSKLFESGAKEVSTDLAQALLAHRKAFPSSYANPADDPILMHLDRVLATAGQKWTGETNDGSNQAGPIAAWAVAHLDAIKGLTGPQMAPLDADSVGAHVTRVETAAYDAINLELSGELLNGCKDKARSRAKELQSYDPASAVTQALEDLTGDADRKVFDKWFNGVVSASGLDRTAMDDVSSLAAAISPTNEVAAELSDLVQTCRDLTERTGSRIKAGPIENLRDDLRKIAEIKTPSKRADNLIALLERFEAERISGDSMESAFTDELRSQIILNQQKVLRAEYFDRLSDLVKDDRKNLLALWGTVKDPEADKQRAALIAIFGEGRNSGWYPKNRSSFRLGELSRKKKDFRDPLSDDKPFDRATKKLRELDTFLEKLAMYLHGPEGDDLTDADGVEIPLYMSSESDERFAFHLTPSKEVLSSTNGGWNEFSGFDSVLLVEGTDVMGIIPGSSEIFETRKVEAWSYERGGTIDMTLQRGRDTSSVEWETTSPLAPLQFWWQAGMGDGLGTVGKNSASFALVVDKENNIKVAFKITFEDPPPMRPLQRNVPL